MDTSEPEFILA